MDRLLEVLTGLAPLPPTRFVGHEGPIDDESWTRLLEALRHNREAVGVRLRGCGLSCTRASQLAEALATNTGLEVLELPDNSIGERGVQAMIETLRLSNCTLKSIDLSGNPCCEDAAHALLELDGLLKRNRVIKKLPKTPAGGSSLSMCGSLASKSAHHTPGNTLPTPQLSQAFLATTGLTSNGFSFELEQRLQHLEEAEATIRSELEHVRSFSSQSEVWQKKIDAAGQQIAAILSLVDSRNLTLEARLQTMEHWRASAEQAWAGQSKVLEDMAGQLLGLMRRVQALEALLGWADVSNGRASSIAVSVRSSAGPVNLEAALSSAEAPNAFALWQEMTDLRERLAKLEAAPANAAQAKASCEECPQRTIVEQQQQEARAAEDKEANVATQHGPRPVAGNGAGDAIISCGQQHAIHGDSRAACDATGAPSSAETGRREPTLSASVSELSSVDNLSPALRTHDPDATGSTTTGPSASPVPMSKKHGGGSSSRPWWKKQQSQTARNTGSLQDRRGVGVKPLQVPSSPILWHVNTFAVSPGSCAITPTRERASMFETVKAQPLPTGAMPSGNGSHGGVDMHDIVDEQVDSGECSGFVMYAAVPPRMQGMAHTACSSAAQRYTPSPSDPRDSVEISTHLRAPAPEVNKAMNGGIEDASADAAAAVAAACHEVPMLWSVITPGKPGPAHDPPDTPRGSTFSVDADTVSLSVVMAGSAARPRAPAVATTDFSPLAYAVSTKDPVEPEIEWSIGCPPGDRAKQLLDGAVPELGSAALAASSSSIHVAKDGCDSDATEVLGTGEALPRSPRIEAGVEVQTTVQSIDASGVTVRAWAASLSAEASAPAPPVTSTGNLTPTSKTCPTASPTVSASNVRQGQQHYMSSPLCSVAPRRTAAPRASRSGTDAHHRSIAHDVKAAAGTSAAAAVLSPGRHEGHGNASRPPHAPPHHQQAATVAAAGVAVSVSSRPRDLAGHEKEHGVQPRATSSSVISARELAVPLSTEDVAGAGVASSAGAGLKGNAHLQSLRSGACTAPGGHPPHSAGPHTTAAVCPGQSAGHVSGPGRASLQAHSARSFSSHRGETGVGASAKPGGAGAGHRITKSGVGSLHRPNATAATGAMTVGASINMSRSASSSTSFAAPTVAAAIADQSVRHGSSLRARRTEGGASMDAGPISSHSVAADPPEAEDSQGQDVVFTGPVVTAYVQAVELVARKASQSDGGVSGGNGHDAGQGLREICKEHSTCSLDTGEAAAAAAQGGSDGAAAAVFQQPQHSSRGYRPGARTLVPGAAANIAGPHLKGVPARMSIRNVTSVAGATKRWM
ncbi:hypothetical protein Vretimale_6701 [Volvox reticuliferus]|uniref:Uncharacterized protein n=1 Tax=Volvox reticuliferus TaxID=1737510 RepID=A0A8J4CFJ7_9CHLO|nr:hypothetical protein Vretifemale_7185 [Volvox reticuliferus]GIM01995.1 hypothetical protein Vretimale_6701 [Volvox reticuliferus]